MKILVTSSTGMTGKAVVKSLASKGITVRAMVHNATKAGEMMNLGASETVIADIASYNNLISAMSEMDAVYYICPTARADEAEIGKLAIRAAQEAGISRFIYQSVLHSIEPELPHHRQKLEVERALVDSGLIYTIVCPAPFMQNTLNSKDALMHDKMFVQKFFTSPESTNLINLIDVKDFADCVAEVAINPGYRYATLELCGPENLSAQKMIAAFAKVLGYTPEFKFISDGELEQAMTKRHAPEYSITTLLKMFNHYNTGDFCGSPFVTAAILKRNPTTFTQFLERELR